MAVSLMLCAGSQMRIVRGWVALQDAIAGVDRLLELSLLQKRPGCLQLRLRRRHALQGTPLPGQM